MSITKERKQELAEKYGSDINDTGSVSVQISILTDRILYLTEHMKKHKKDFSSRRGLLTLVSKRRKLLMYLKTKKEKEYLELIAKLGLRR